MNKLMQLLAINARSKLDELKISQSELARRSKVSHPFISNVMNGRVENLQLLGLEKLAKGLEVSPIWLLTDHSKEPIAVKDELKEAIEGAMKKIADERIPKPEKKPSGKLEQLLNLVRLLDESEVSLYYQAIHGLLVAKGVIHDNGTRKQKSS